jgi:hypothetical protein
MSQTLERIRKLVSERKILISDHGYDELANDGLFIQDILAGVSDAVVVEDYPNYHKGPCVLVRQRDAEGNLIHVVWGIPKKAFAPAVLVTAYRPDPDRWSDDFLGRR